MKDDDDELFTVPLEEWTAKRNTLGLKGLKKPTAPVWALNQWARRHAGEVKALLDAVERLRKAVKKGDREAMKAAIEDERTGVAKGLAEATAILSEGGHATSPEAIRRLQQTLRSAAAGDEEIQEKLARGRLTEELEPAGFGAIGGEVAVVAAPKKKPEPEPEREKHERLEKRKEAERLAAIARKLEDKAKELREKADVAEREARAARAAADKARNHE